ncbi:MAG TPA: hypothetical protein VG412_00500 [Acidimicrobiales bacterium]|nr:hypothetical protein [Acidimicrobiales bacterium]
MTADSPTAVPASPDAPGALSAPSIRYRCAACGNLTRFSVVTNRRTRAFHHFSVGGELSLEDVEVLDETVEEVSCRWCGNGNAIETVDIVEGATPNPG